MKELSSYIAHMRPKSFPVTFFSALTGYAISPGKATSWEGILFDLSLLFILFSVLIWGGTNAFNSGQDGDEGSLNLLPDPPPVPKHLSQFGILLMLAAIALSSIKGWPLVLLSTIALILSLFYSWKNPYFRRGKDIPVIDMLINAGGFGLCSILMGYFLTPSRLTGEVWIIGAGFTFAYWGGMPTSQIFQLKAGEATSNYTSIVTPSRFLKQGAVFFTLHLLTLGMLVIPGWRELISEPLRFSFWLGWIILVAIGSIHSLWWSRSPFTDPYKRMMRQMTIMMGSQVCWTAYAWLK